MIRAPLVRRSPQAPLLLLFLAGLGPAAPASAQQARASQMISRYGLAAYFADSLRVGSQRTITTDGATGWISDQNAVLTDVLLPVRVAPTAVVDPPTASGDRRVVLPDRAFVEPSGGPGMLLVPVVVIEGGGLRYTNGAFRGSIRVGVEDSLRTGSSVSLPTPIRFFVSGTADSILLPDTAVLHTNLPFSVITLVETTRGAAVSLNVRTTLHSDGVDLEVPITLEPLDLDANPPRLQGLGLEETRLGLGPAPSGVGVAVRLVADNGNLAADEVRLSSDGTASTTLRSYWIGTATVTARSVPFADSQTTVQFLFPWLFLAAALLGGSLGGLARWMGRKRSEAEGPKWLTFVGGGAVLGLIAAVLYAVGVNVTPINPTVTTGQAVVLGLAAVIGYIGTLPISSGGEGQPS